MPFVVRKKMVEGGEEIVRRCMCGKPLDVCPSCGSKKVRYQDFDGFCECQDIICDDCGHGT